MYTDHGTGAEKAGGVGAGTERRCRWCGAVLVKPRRNQTCCDSECRGKWEEAKRDRRRQAAKPQGNCMWCDGPFDRVRGNQDFCCTGHQQAFNNFWKGKGPLLARALHVWRVGRDRGGMTDLCREFSIARDELKERQADARAAQGG